MHDTLRMNYDLHPAHRHIEKPTGLDHLEPFIKKSGRIDRDFLTHFPGWMPQSIQFGNVFQMFSRQLAEWTARGSQNEILNLLVPLRFQALKNCVVLAVNG